MATSDQYIHTLVTAHVLPASAINLHPHDAFDAYNTRNNLTLNDDGYLIHPDLIETATTHDGNTRRAWRLRTNPHVTVDTLNLKLAQGADTLSRNLGNLIFR